MEKYQLRELNALGGFFSNEDERIRANDEFANFSLKSGPFADPDSIGSMYVIDPRKWWHVLVLMHLYLKEYLVFIHNNLRLLSRNSSQYYDEKTKLWDVGGDQFGSMEDVEVLEFANLSLDEPELESILFDENTTTSMEKENKKDNEVEEMS
ncbi:hypothetical protein GH714_011583 [Hevea brasiliensis]|uniref:Uncharacterized protein n=1 Tax=Hevea brasiliensis TaxID=3981 RepID=A0A6A6KJW1_HEVBR|nr:hypothetical protein GH714_011583 [Hevea brasiliensis]